MDGAFSSPTSGGTRGLFSHVLLWESGPTPGRKTQNWRQVGYDRGPQEFLMLRAVYTKLPASHQWQFQLSTPAVASGWSLTVSVSFSVITCMPLHSWWQQFALRFSPLLRIVEELLLLFLVASAFYLLLHLLNKLYVECSPISFQLRLSR